MQVNECFLGIFNIIEADESAVQCDWYMYRIEDPLWTYQAPVDFELSGTYQPDSCNFSPLEFLTPESWDEVSEESAETPSELIE